jgi:NAD(P)-dependent dehydrogenase (short-subunit alcohol dehydrogenase family)
VTAGGSIVTIGSVAYKKGLSPMSVYASAKAAVRYSVKGWAAGLIGKGVRVNNFSPGVADTPILDSSDGWRERPMSLVPASEQLGEPCKQDITASGILVSNVPDGPPPILRIPDLTRFRSCPRFPPG